MLGCDSAESARDRLSELVRSLGLKVRLGDFGIRGVRMSGFDEGDVMAHLATEKRVGFLHKPWEPPDLLSAIDRTLSAEPVRG